MDIKKISPSNLHHGGFSNSNKYSDKEWINIERINKICYHIERKFKKIKTINSISSSYGIKHEVERSLGFYISNGELILSMIVLGFSYRRLTGNASINCFFNVSTKSLKSITHEN